MRRAIVLLVVVAACARHRDAPSWYSSVAEKHAQADRLIESGSPAEAERTLASILAEVTASPADGDRRTVLQDTYFRLARLSLARGDAQQALRRADEGLALGRRDDLFVANLHVARGAALESLDQADAASEAFASALRINEKLLRTTLEER